MTLKSNQVLDALHGIVSALSGNANYPKVERNATLDEAFEQLENDNAAYANMRDGDAVIENQALGTDCQYEVVQQAFIELYVKCDDEDKARLQLGALIESTHDAIEQASQSGALANVYAGSQTAGLQRTNLASDGIPGLKACILTIDLTFLSERPF